MLGNLKRMNLHKTKHEHKRTRTAQKKLERKLELGEMRDEDIFHWGNIHPQKAPLGAALLKCGERARGEN
jgi:hypothetical protein